MGSITVSIDGVEKTIKRIKDVSALQVKAIQEAINESCLNIERNAKRGAPVDTGRLRSSLRIRFTANTDKAYGQDVFTNVNYASFIEGGTGIYATKGDGRKTPWVYKGSDGRFYHTRGMKARPFLVPAFQAEQKNLLSNLRAILSSNT